MSVTPPFDLPQTTALIRCRRSIKPVDMDPARVVPESLLRELLENATWAPTHGLTEPWKFHIYQGDARQRLSQQMQQVYQEITPTSEFREDKMKKMGDNPRLTPVIIAAVMERRGGTKIPEIEEIEAVACALQNLQLSATAAGLACYWSSPPLLEAESFKKWLGLGVEDRCVGLIYLGWPKAGLTPPRSVRQPLETKVVWHHV